MPTSTLTTAGTPYEAWHKQKPDISNFCVFGCTAYVHVQKDKRTGIGSHMQKCIFVGYPQDYKGWRFYNPVTRRFIISERAEFDERYYPGLKRTNTGPPTFDPPPDHNAGGDEDKYVDDPFAPAPHIPQPDVASRPVTPDPPADLDNRRTPSPVPPPSPPGRRYPARTRKQTGEWWVLPQKPKKVIESDTSEEEDDDDGRVDLSEVEEAHSAQDSEPLSFAQACKRNDAAEWRKAAQTEMDWHHQNGTWELIDAPPGANIIPCKWVFKVKRNADGSVERYKARLVAKGFKQRPGFDYSETFSPTYRPATIRLIFALAAQHDMHLRSVDITSAFPLGDLDEVVLMRQAEGFQVGGPNC